MAKPAATAKKRAKKAETTAAERRETPVVQWRISQEEYDERVARVGQELERRRLDALVLFHPIRMAYTSGFYHVSTERPMAIVIPLDPKHGLGALIPQLEQDHIAKSPGVRAVKVYPEYPSGGTKHPMLHLADLLKEMGLAKAGTRIGYDSNGYLDINGYDGPELSEVVATGVETVRARDIIDTMRAVKSRTELDFIKRSCVWGNLAHRIMHNNLELGRTEIEISMEAGAEASRIMVAALGPAYQPLTSNWGQPALVIFHAGSNTALPHGLMQGGGLQRGDVLVTGAGADFGGYNSELERTMILGEPTAEFERYFQIMLDLQQTAFDALRPGRTLAEAETDVARAFKDFGVTENQRHHTGHSIGLEGHEAPFIDKGDETVIEENMVFTIEPGLYVPGVAGFRHSDTVVVRADGVERLTFYPRDLASLIVRL
ncbi:MAG: Xaa-Pro peptidase family protein [Chloroflexota bacterium]|nr:Xaa-Pro peptidase family protein [Chloroflexota bacterium]